MVATYAPTAKAGTMGPDIPTLIILTVMDIPILPTLSTVTPGLPAVHPYMERSGSTILKIVEEITLLQTGLACGT